MNVPLLDLKAQFVTIGEDVRAAVDRVLESQRFVLSHEGQAPEDELSRYGGTLSAIGFYLKCLIEVNQNEVRELA